MPVRVYAPVGEHRDLLAYLVRRLLENGANSSFVHQLADDDGRRRRAARLAAACRRRAPALPLPVDAVRRRARATRRASTSPAWPSARRCERAVAATQVERVAEADARRRRRRDGAPAAGFARLERARRSPSAPPCCAAPPTRSKRACPSSAALLVKEAHKTLGDCVAEVREAVDFCATTPTQAERGSRRRRCPARPARATSCACTAAASSSASARGTSRWRSSPARWPRRWSPATAVAAKPAEQTPRVAQRMVALLHEAGVPADALALLHGPGETVGAALVADAAHRRRVLHRLDRGGARSSTARWPPRTAPIVPLIAETGGINAMIVDCTRAARAGGRRGGAERLPLRRPALLGAAPAVRAREHRRRRDRDDRAARWRSCASATRRELATDVGPVIDAEAYDGIARHVAAPAPRGAGCSAKRRVADAGAAH